MAQQIVNELLDELAKKHPDSEYRALVRLFKREHGREPEIDLKAVLGDFAKERPQDGQRSLYKLFKRQHGWAPPVKMFPTQFMEARPQTEAMVTASAKTPTSRA